MQRGKSTDHVEAKMERVNRLILINTWIYAAALVCFIAAIVKGALL